jgi:FixJ family two-component response regulator
MPPAVFIAIVDDEEPVRRALVRLLRSAGYQACAFASGKQLLEFLKTDVPTCVLLDLHMPEMSGLDVQQRLSLERPGLPVIFITGHHSAETAHRAQAANAWAYLLKPVNDRLLLDTIASIPGMGSSQ